MIAFEHLGYTEHFAAAFDEAPAGCTPGRVVSLDRGFPLVCIADGEFRAELATDIKKREDSIVAIGDWVALMRPDAHEKAIIAEILPRRTEIARVKRVGREKQVRRQVLAANVDTVLICHSLTGRGLDERLVLRQIVAALGCNAQPVVVLTKSDMVDGAAIDAARASVNRVFGEVEVVVTSCDADASSRSQDDDTVARVRKLCPPQTTTLLLGESGVGKSTLANALLGHDALATGAVRSSDDKGRHTTVARRMVEIPDGGLMIDAPGLRTLQILDVEKSLNAAFPEVERFARECRFANCSHTHEPGCAVCENVSAPRLETYFSLKEHR